MRLRRALMAALAVALPPAAQGQHVVTVRADNDAFNFWQLPWRRPDEEYTSGVRLTVEFPGTAAWARRLGLARDGCRGDTVPCATHTYAFGQDIFTAVRPRNVPTARPGGRPDAGVLWISSTNRRERTSHLTEFGWTLGITGKPSLAETMQRLFHDMAPSLNRPITWSAQIPAEPVFAVRLDRRQLARAGALEVQPHAGASLGSLLTEVRAGMGVRLGPHLAHPWMNVAGGRLQAALVGDATVRAVARNEVLNGALFRSGPHVTTRPIVTELQAGVRLRWHMLEASWLAHQTGAEYVPRTLPHTWSTLEASWFPTRRR